jgi:hypothetical protein
MVHKRSLRQQGRIVFCICYLRFAVHVTTNEGFRKPSSQPCERGPLEPATKHPKRLSFCSQPLIGTEWSSKDGACSEMDIAHDVTYTTTHRATLLHCCLHVLLLLLVLLLLVLLLLVLLLLLLLLPKSV